jgi:hypothetical protein
MNQRPGERKLIDTVPLIFRFVNLMNKKYYLLKYGGKNKKSIISDNFLNAAMSKFITWQIMNKSFICL